MAKEKGRRSGGGRSTNGRQPAAPESPVPPALGEKRTPNHSNQQGRKEWGIELLNYLNTLARNGYL